MAGYKRLFRAELSYASSDETTDITTGTDKFTYTLPNFATTLTDVSASIVTAPTGSTAIFDLNIDTVSALSTKLSIDIGEFTSETAAVQPVISNSAMPANAIASVDFDQIGSTITGAGVKFWIYYQRA